MDQDSSNYCLVHNCGKCCMDLILKVTEGDLERWKNTHPKILNEITSRVIDGKMKQILNKRPVKCPDGKLHDVCVFYDFDNKCLIYEIRPENCRKFRCTKHVSFFFHVFNGFSQLIEEFGSKP